MDIRSYVVYKFDELSDEAKEKAIMNLFDINVGYIEWWECIYDEVENRFGDCTELIEQYPFVESIKITGFDLDRNLGATIKTTLNSVKFFEHYFKNHHHKTMLINLLKNDFIYEDGFDQFLVNGRASRVESLLDDIDLKDIEKELSEVIASRLQSEYDYLTSEKAIVETIQCNDYDFTEDGKLD